MNGTIETAFSGRVGTDPERRTSQAGKPWLRFSVAVGSDDAVQWVQVAVFGQQAEDLSTRLHKGDRVYVEGTLRLNTWTDHDGRERSGLSVAAWKGERLGAIGRNKPRRQDKPSLPATDERAMQRTQQPLDEALIPF
ncbi:single-stranded DNA-binding protein [Hyphomicrobium sp. D-2]|uniref:single-stranded DNA-binding protein n=1 Tax=Hyphomicrobium sp. D-2 TaxID=3041621 RepID=UPI002458BBA2|nr:single-stranded DNA-binding protein [Hyphomicrobium sp. D-2]MDH4981239.1 single-stranded DNA-binding protein [Hyphomicrobium sp. D-2]